MSIINPTNPHSFYKSDRTAILNDCGYEITYTIEGDTIFTKRFYNNGTETTCQVIIDKLGNVKTTSTTEIPQKGNIALAQKKMYYELQTTASNGSQTRIIDNYNPLENEGFNLTQTGTFNSNKSGNPTSYHGYYTKTESDDKFLSQSDLIGAWAGFTIPTFIITLTSVLAYFNKLKNKLPLSEDKIIFIAGEVKESLTENTFSLRQNRNIFTYDALLQTGSQGFRGYSRKKKK
ncbi:MAG TPA: hypothetical protein V6C58_11515 [Allocoleopsis sp.]